MKTYELEYKITNRESGVTFKVELEVEAENADDAAEHVLVEWPADRYNCECLKLVVA